MRVQELRLEREKDRVECAALERECARLQEYIGKCERLIDKERARADAERERADRQLDGLLQQNGLAPVTQVVREERNIEQSEYLRKDAERMRQLAEIGRDAMDSIYTEDGLELPSHLADAARAMLEKDSN